MTSRLLSFSLRAQCVKFNRTQEYQRPDVKCTDCRMNMINVKKRKYHGLALSSAYGHYKETKDSIRKSAKLFGVPESTLRARVHNPNLLQTHWGHMTFFTKNEEALLADHCKIMSRMGYGYSRVQVIQMASSMAEATGKTGCPKKDWYYGFVKRFPDLSITKPKKREVSRVRGANETNISNYFSELEIILNKYNLKDKPAQIWNIDETGITLDVTPPKILSARGDKPFVITPSRGATTVIAAANALGQVLPPYVIYKGQRLTAEITSGCLPETKFAVTQTGWSTALTFQDFIQHHFIPNVTEKPCLLLYDGHSTHITVSLIELARKSDIHMFVLPPHSSHVLQPLDVGIFSPFKASLSSQCHILSHSQPGRQITRSDLTALIAKAYEAAFTTANLMSAFRKTGVVPFNPAVFNIHPLVPTQKEIPGTRKERKDVRHINLLLKEKESKMENSVGTGRKIKKYVVPQCGTAITEEHFLEKLKDGAMEKAGKDKVKKVKVNEQSKGKGKKKQNLEGVTKIEAQKPDHQMLNG